MPTDRNFTSRGEVFRQSETGTGDSVNTINLNPFQPKYQRTTAHATLSPAKHLAATSPDSALSVLYPHTNFTASVRTNQAGQQVQNAPIPVEENTPTPQNQSANLHRQIPVCAGPARILVADDNLLVRTCMMNLLDQWKMNYVICENGQQAWQMLQEEDFDLVLLDLQMPLMDGHEVVARLRAATNNPNRHIPMIALAGNGDTAAKEKMFSAGINAYLTKPFQPGVLFQTITSYTAIPDHSKTLLYSDILDQQLLRELYADDVEQLDFMFNLFLHHTPPALQVMTAALQREDWVVLEQEVHKVKPTFAMVGLQKITEMAGRLEEILSRPEPISTTIGVDFNQFKAAVQQALNTVSIKQTLIRHYLK